MTDLSTLTAAGIRERVAAREVSCEEVVREHLARIDAVEPAVDAFLALAPERALERAQRLDAELARAIQHAQASLLTLDEYKTFGLHNDLKALEPSQGLWCNLLHLHGHDIYFSVLDSLNSRS